MIIIVIPKGDINSGSFIRKLWVIMLEEYQMKLPAIEYHTASTII